MHLMLSKLLELCSNVLISQNQKYNRKIILRHFDFSANNQKMARNKNLADIKISKVW